MRKLFTGTLAMIMTLALFVGCGSKGNSGNVTTASIADEISTNIEMRMTAKIEGELLTEKFHLNMDDIEEETVLEGQMNSALETIAIIKAKEGKVDSVKASLEKVLEDKKAAAFYPGEPEAVEAAEVKVIGNYVALIIIPDYEEGENNTQKAVEMFEKALQ